jgi:hypothetical protein
MWCTIVSDVILGVGAGRDVEHALETALAVKLLELLSVSLGLMR